jgi:hypothetical protein
MKCFLTEAITGTTGTVSTGLKKNLKTIPGKNSADPPTRRTRKITHNKQRVTIKKLKPEWWVHYAFKGKSSRKKKLKEITIIFYDVQ